MEQNMRYRNEYWNEVFSTVSFVFVEYEFLQGGSQ